MQKRMQGLLNFAKPLEPRPVGIEINKLVREAVETLRSRFSEAKVDARMDLAADIPSVTSDLNHLEQALLVLITNALEASGTGDVVTVRTGTSIQNGGKKTVYISVEDDGQGIAPENRERVFEPFFTTKSHGTGLGLPLAKKFIERNRGRIAITNGSRNGTKAEIILPVAP